MFTSICICQRIYFLEMNLLTFRFSGNKFYVFYEFGNLAGHRFSNKLINVFVLFKKQQHLSYTLPTFVSTVCMDSLVCLRIY